MRPLGGILAALVLLAVWGTPAYATNWITHYQSVNDNCGTHTTYSDSWPTVLDPNTPNDANDDEVAYSAQDIRVRASGYQDLRDVWVDVYKLQAGSQVLYDHHWGDHKSWGSGGPNDGTILFSTQGMNDINRPRHPYLVVEANYAGTSSNCKIYTAWDMGWAPGH